MYIIAGLGNPDRQYQNTRHNVGFDVIDVIADKYDIAMGERKHKAIIGKGYIAGQKVVLVKPQTYMNLSAIAESIKRFAIKVSSATAAAWKLRSPMSAGNGWDILHWRHRYLISGTLREYRAEWG